jgi:hypothetical protein
MDFRRERSHLGCAFSLCLLTFLMLALPTASRADTQPSSTFHISFDDTAVRGLIALIKAKDTSDASLDRWLDLPANKYVVKIGVDEQALTRDQFKQNAIAVINGTATPQSQPADDIGCLRMSSPDDFSSMLDALESTEKARVARITARLQAFAPPGTNLTEVVYIHLGGDWDAVNDHGAIYLNMRFWHDTHQPGWDGLNMIVAHETTHSVQNLWYGNPEDQSDGPGAFLTALSKIQREGTARYVEYDADPGPYAPWTYGFFERALDTESSRSFPQDVQTLQPIYDACFPKFNHDQYVQAFETGIGNGGPFYDVGYGMAQAIDTHMGRRALTETIVRGPKLFFQQYAGLCASDPELPKLPPEVMAAVDEMPDKLPPSGGA